MIELIEGAPGAGKTLMAVRDRLLYWFQHKKPRPLYVHCRGVTVERWASLFGIPFGELEERMTVWPWEEHEAVPGLLLTVRPNSFVLIDEAQFVFRSRMQVAPEVIRWFETHRHRGIDVCLTCQDYRQLTSAVTRLVETTLKCVRLSYLGADSLAQVQSRGNPEDPQIVYRYPLTYDRKTVKLYESYADGVAEEVRHVRSILRSPVMLVTCVAGLFVVVVFTVKPWTSLAQTGEQFKAVAQAVPGGAQSQAGGGSVPLERRPPASADGGTVRYGGAHGSQGLSEAERGLMEKPKVLVVGRVGIPRDDRQPGPHKGLMTWRYLLDTGEIMTAEQVAIQYGIPVHEMDDPFEPGMKRLVGPGIEYRRRGE